MIFDGPYSRFTDYLIAMPDPHPKKYWSGTPVNCAICKRGNVTLLKRDGKRICRDCDAMMQRAERKKGETP